MVNRTINKMRVAQNDKQMSSHLPILLKALQATKGDVCELGAGFYSTPFLHWLCLDRNLVSYEDNPDYFHFAKRFQTKRHRIRPMSSIEFDRHWGIVFIDHDGDRGSDALKFTNADMIILHDTEPDSRREYGYDKIWSQFKYKQSYTEYRPNVSVLSNTIDVTKLDWSPKAPEKSQYTLSFLIPSRREQFLNRTIQDLIENTSEESEILVGLDGEWPEVSIPNHPRVKILFYPESIGQRAMTNRLASISQAKYVCKVDAHCSFDKEWDKKMVQAFKEVGDDVTMVSVMRNLHAFDWVCPDGHRRYQSPSGPCKDCGKPTMQDVVWYAKPRPNSTSYCFDKTLHFQYFNDYKSKQESQGDLVETMSLQGSCFMMTREKYWELNICDEQGGSWGHQGSEVALKTWLSGGRVICNRRTWYAHLFRTQGGDFSFPWPAKEREIEKTRQYFRDIFLEDRWPKATRKLQWLVDKFSPVPGWDS